MQSFSSSTNSRGLTAMKFIWQVCKQNVIQSTDWLLDYDMYNFNEKDRKRNKAYVFNISFNIKTT